MYNTPILEVTKNLKKYSRKISNIFIVCKKNIGKLKPTFP